MNKTPGALLRRDLQMHIAAKRELIPLRKQAKEPLESNWPKKHYTEYQLLRFIHNNHNIGWRLGPRDLVIDIDPRHPGALQSEEKLTQQWGVENLSDICPTVHTGGIDQGKHYYLKLPENVNPKFKGFTRSKNYPDLDFRHRGQYVLIAGCLHPSGRLYQWDPFAPKTPPTVPHWLLEELGYRLIDSPPSLGSRATSDQIPKPTQNPQLTLPEIQSYLRQIPVIDFRDYDKWLRIGMAVHNASHGAPEALEAWILWSTSDPQYTDAEEVVRAKWRSFSDNPQAQITASTLIKTAMDYGAPPTDVMIDPETDFNVKIETAPSCDRPPLDLFHRWINKTHRPNLQKAVETAIKYGEKHWDDLRGKIGIAYQAPFPKIDKLAEEINGRKFLKQTDAAIAIADHILVTRFKKGKNLLHARNQLFYEFVKTHWEPVPPNIMDKHIFDAGEELQIQKSRNKLKFKTSSVFNATNKVLVAKTAKQGDIFRFQSEPPAVVNTKNWEIWINEDGSITPKKHRSESYLLNCLETEYDPLAECRLFDETLQGIFANNDDPDELIRHFWEFAGYVLQPHKNIPCWFLWHGRGQNGKSILIEIIQALLGNAVLPRSMIEFAEQGRNAHAIASLVGKLLVVDDDAQIDSFLPESALKKLAESRLFEANPKHRDAFVFRACATPVLLINDWPKVKDLSWGMIRKVFIMPFKRAFSDIEQDNQRKHRIISTELPGALNRALAGYRRLRNRGYFLEPEECKRAKKQWLRSANPLMEFIESQTKKSQNGAYTPKTDIYQLYQLWCVNYGGIQRPLAQHRFDLSLMQLGYQIDYKDGIEVFIGIQPKA